jgi:hypothetical protein
LLALCTIAAHAATLPVEALYKSYKNHQSDTSNMPEFGKEFRISGVVLGATKSIAGNDLFSIGAKDGGIELARATFDDDATPEEIGSLTRGKPFLADCIVGFVMGADAPYLQQCTLSTHVAKPPVKVAYVKPDMPTLLKKILQCQASQDDLQYFTDLAYDGKLPLTATKVKFGSLNQSWELKDPVQVEGLSSKIIIMNTRYEYYIQMMADNPGTDIPAIAKKIGAKETMNYEGYLEYEKREQGGTIHILTPREITKSHEYWVGCGYDENKIKLN